MRIIIRLLSFVLLLTLLQACGGSSSSTDPDRDGDGVPNAQDAFPDDASESVDSDGDGIGDNADPDADADGDGVRNDQDAFPADASETVDTDSDGIGDNADTDDDNDTVEDTADVDQDGDGLIELYTLEQLDWVRNDLQGTSLNDGSNPANSTGCPSAGCIGYEQMADWDFDTNGDSAMDAGDDWFDYDGDGSNSGWLPIGTDSAPFQASFNGNGYQILNLYIDRPSSDTETSGNAIGLFGSVGGATATRDISITDIHISGDLSSITGNGNVGSVIGSLNNPSGCMINVTLSQLDADASISTTGNRTGGLVGQFRHYCTATTVSLAQLAFSGEIAGSSITGGLFGELRTDGPTITLSDVNIDATIATDSSYMGGLFGQINVYDGSLTMSEVSIAGELTASAAYTGGLTAYLWINDDASFSLTSFSNTALVTGQSYVAGMIAYLEYEGAIIFDDLTNSGNISGTDDAGGLFAYSDGYSGNPNTSFALSNAVNTGNVSGGGVVGGVAGELDNNGGPMTITDIASSGFISSTGNYYTGGALGYLYVANAEAVTTVTRAFASGKVSANNSTGGLIGWVTVRNAASLTVTDSGATGNVNGVDNVGGFIGEIDDGSTPSTLIRFNSAFATGDVTATGDNVGGFAGSSEQTTIEASFSTGSVNGNANVGGFIGRANTGTLIDSSYTASPVNGSSNVGAFTGESTDASYSGAHYVDEGAGPLKIASLVSGTDPGSSLVGYTLAELQCPVISNDVGCTGVTLYDEWQLKLNSDGDAAWDFGTTAELPGLNIGDTVYRDADGDGALD